MNQHSTVIVSSDIRLATTGADCSVISTGSAVVSMETGSSAVSMAIWTSLVDTLSTAQKKTQLCEWVCVAKLMPLNTQSAAHVRSRQDRQTHPAIKRATKLLSAWLIKCVHSAVILSEIHLILMSKPQKPYNLSRVIRLWITKMDE